MKINTHKGTTQIQTPAGKYRWTICSLVFFATTINYLDRQVFSLLKPMLEKQFNWRESDYSNIVIGFQFSYALGMLCIGRIIDKVGTKIGYAASLILWSVAAVLHAFATSTFSFGLVRSFLGISEAGNFPAAIKTTAEWFPQKERAFAAGIFNSGTNVGAVIAPVVVPWLAINYSWKIAFIATGATGLLWVVFWLRTYEIPSLHPKLTREEFAYIQSDASGIGANHHRDQPKISWSHLLIYRQTWAFVAGKFLTDGIWWFILFWLPAFLNAQYKLVGMQVSFPIAVVYIMAGFASVFGGWLPMWLVKNRNWDAVKARKYAMLIYAVFPLIIIFAQAIGNYNLWYAVIIIGIAASAHQAWSANLFTIVSDMFPKNLVGSVIGIGGMIGAVGGMLIAKLAGILFDHYQSLGDLQTGYYFMFIICGFAYLVAWFTMFKVLVPKMQVVKI